jgi:alanyl-tRNA synthetase
VFQTAFQPNAFQNNAFQINVEPVGGDDGGHWTKEELQRVKRLHQKIAERQRKLEQATKDANASRKQAFKDQIDPVAKVKQSKVQSKQEVEADIPSVNTQELQRSISYLENQLNNILGAVAYRQEAARIQAELRMLEAKRLEELDDEESILILLH